MPMPEAQDAVETFKRLLDAQDRAASAQVVRAYAPVYQQLAKDTEALVRVAQTRGLKPWQVMRMERLKALEGQFVSSASRFAEQAGESITRAQRTAVGLARRGTERTVAAALPQGISMDNLARLGLGWNRLPEEAFTNFIGISGDGRPVGRLLAELGSDAAPQVRAAIGNGIALGKGPRQTAQLVRVAAGMPLSRALTITRTETNRAYREATRLQYANNSQVVKGYRRHAAKDDRTCMACIALDGELYELNEPLNEHPNGRCALVPEVLDYADLGLDMPRTPQPGNARDWLANQSDDVQRRVLGAGRFDAFKAGEIELDQLATIKRSRVWGDAIAVKPIANMTTKSSGSLSNFIAIKQIMAPPKPKPRKLRPQPKQTEPAPSPLQEPANLLDTMELPISGPRSPQELSTADIVRNNVKILERTQEGRELASAVGHWSRGGNDGMRRGAQKWLEGKERLTIGSAPQETGAKLAEAVSVAPRMKEPVSRGIRIGKDMREVEGFYPKGKVFDSQIASYSTSENAAGSFAGKGVTPGESSVVLNVEAGARGLNIEPISSYIGEAERIVAGRFEVLGTRRVVTPNAVGSGVEGTVLHIDLRQINTLIKEIK